MAYQLADQISEVTHQPTTASISPSCDKASLIQQIEDLTHQEASLTLHRNRLRSHSRGRGNTQNLSPKKMVLQIPPSAGTTSDSGTKRRSVHRLAPSVSRKTPTAGVDGMRHLHSTIGHLFVMDRTSKHRSLVDTGLDLYMFTSKWVPGYQDCMNHDLFAANKTTTRTYG